MEDMEAQEMRAHHKHAGQKTVLDPVDLKLHIAVHSHVTAGNQICVLCMRSKHPNHRVISPAPLANSVRPEIGEPGIH